MHAQPSLRTVVALAGRWAHGEHQVRAARAVSAAASAGQQPHVVKPAVSGHLVATLQHRLLVGALDSVAEVLQHLMEVDASSRDGDGDGDGNGVHKALQELLAWHWGPYSTVLLQPLRAEGVSGLSLAGDFPSVRGH